MPRSEEDLIRDIRSLDARIWKQRITQSQIDEWLECFTGSVEPTVDERHDALALLSRFTFFGVDEVRVLLTSLYHQHVVYPIVREFRLSNDGCSDVALIEQHIRAELDRTLFVGAGNPAESGAHILYYFRQVNKIPLRRFASADWLLSRSDSKLADLSRIVLVDDFCGSGQSATAFGRSIVEPVQERRSSLGLSPALALYITVAGTSRGIENARESGYYDAAGTVLLFDDSHRVFSETSRYFPEGEEDSMLTNLRLEQVKEFVSHYGRELYSRHPLGYKDGQIMLGFSHNIPNNTLPVFWSDGDEKWRPIFRRYGKN